MLQRAISVKKKKESIEEEMRLLYVALTRAKNHLYVLGEMANSEKFGTTYYPSPRSFLEMINNAFFHNKLMFHYFKKPETFSTKLDGEIGEKIPFAARTPSEEIVKELEKNLLFEYPHRDAVKLSSKYTVTELVKYDYLEAENSIFNDNISNENEEAFIEKNEEAFTDKNDENTFNFSCDDSEEIACTTSTDDSRKMIANSKAKNAEITATAQQDNLSEIAKKRQEKLERGIILHRIIQHLDLTLEKKDEIALAIDDLVKSNILKIEEVQKIRLQDVLKCINSDIIKKVSKGRVLREQPFMLNIPASMVLETACEDSVLVQGVIDLLSLGEENILVDFKASSKSAEALLSTYKKQLLVYKLATESSLDIKVDSMYIYEFFKGIFVKVE